MPSSQSSNSPKGSRRRDIAIHIAVGVLRIAVGVLFIISGFAKAIDPWGTIYKMDEYFAVWHWVIPHALTVTAAVGLSALEFVAGMMLMLGCYRRSIVVILLLVMAGMLPLSVYIYMENPVADCGCFGDLWRISNLATMLKNVLIVAALIFLAVYNRTVRCAVSPYVQWVPAVVTLIYALLLSFEGYQGQPLLDFRSFPVGTSLVPDEDDGGDGGASPEFIFTYEKGGERREFAIDELPDSTWTYIDRRMVNGDAGSRDGFTIYDADGEDVTATVIEPQGRQLLVALPSLQDADISYTYYLNELYRYLSSHDIAMTAVIGGGEKEGEIWQDISMAEYPIYNADVTQIKELVRGTIGLVLLSDGRIEWKRSAGPLLNAMFSSETVDTAPFHQPDGRGARLHALTAAYALMMVVFIALNNGVLVILSAWRARWRKSRAKKHSAASHTEKKS